MVERENPEFKSLNNGFQGKREEKKMECKNRQIEILEY